MPVFASSLHNFSKHGRSLLTAIARALPAKGDANDFPALLCGRQPLFQTGRDGVKF